MSQLGPKKSTLKLKFSKNILNVPNTNCQKTLNQSHTKQEKTKQKQKLKPSDDGECTYKTESQIAFDLIKKHRIIHKMKDKAKTTNKERLQKFHKQLSKLPDHFDLSRTGQKIQKGY